ncbi:hypothetical protein AEAC466_13350 [Asticcacaulis sp. AC466]|uniref:arsenate reductase ArsC n=1 Tax=Asticcacaulis sp. AC466 TaxID=1282362 RepID=UPI0003C3BA4E|nr:arsenate reductase ArsC [Asticcacaulis sp. AC466]ESQ83232.1 hypothetical protein AEAC466_13350 [Asticcacaulis sp. AC466]
MKSVLFLCSSNAGRSILAEALAKELASDHFQAFSAGEEPKSSVNPMVLALLTQKGVSTEGLHSKSWQTFVGEDVPHIDLAITLCNNAVGEMCFPMMGVDCVAHWDIPDPGAANTIDERKLAFERVYERLSRNIQDLCDLPDYEGQRLEVAVNHIGWRNSVSAEGDL